MAIQRYTSYMMHSSMLSDVRGTQGRLFELQGQISSGNKAETFKGLGGQVQLFTSLEAKIKNADTFLQTNALNLARMNTTRDAAGQLIDITDQMEDLIVLRRGAVNPSNTFTQNLEDLQKSAIRLLNSSLEGRFLFGGTRTNKPPVPDVIPAPNELGVPDSGYYEGSTDNLLMRIEDNYTIEMDYRADDPAFQKMFGAIALALEGDASEDDEEGPAMIGQALEMMQEAQAEINAMQASINTDIINVELVNERHTSLKLYWRGVTDQISKTDLVEASTQIAIDQAVLQATYQAFSRISSLQLSNFLN